MMCQAADQHWQGAVSAAPPSVDYTQSIKDKGKMGQAGSSSTRPGFISHITDQFTVTLNKGKTTTDAAEAGET